MNLVIPILTENINSMQSASTKKKSPLHNILNRISHALQRDPQDREQLIELLRRLQQQNLFSADALLMIEGVLQFAEMQVRDIMIPRSQMIVIEEDFTLTQCLPIIINSGHSRFPVIGEDHNEVIGILHAKDLLPYGGKEDSKFNLRDLLRAAVFVPESKQLDTLLKEFRANRNHMAIVVDEYGGVAGFVTIEDVIEQIVGEIEDEFDIDEETFIKQKSPNEYTVKALTPIEEFNQFFTSRFSDEEFDTIGGLVTNTFEYVPKRGEKIIIENFEFEILSADSRRIRLLRVITPTKTENT